MRSLIITLTHGAARADLILQFGEGTDEPSAIIENHSRTEQIKLGEIQRFADTEPAKV